MDEDVSEEPANPNVVMHACLKENLAWASLDIAQAL